MYSKPSRATADTGAASLIAGCATQRVVTSDGLALVVASLAPSALPSYSRRLVASPFDVTEARGSPFDAFVGPTCCEEEPRTRAFGVAVAPAPPSPTEREQLESTTLALAHVRAGRQHLMVQPRRVPAPAAACGRLSARSSVACKPTVHARELVPPRHHGGRSKRVQSLVQFLRQVSGESVIAAILSAAVVSS